MRLSKSLTNDKIRAIKSGKVGSSVAEIMARTGFSRSAIYKWLRSTKNAIGGTIGQVSVDTRFRLAPKFTPDQSRATILKMALLRPTDGKDAIANALHENGYVVSPRTVQNVLNENDLGTQSQRRAMLLVAYKQNMRINASQLEFLRVAFPELRWKDRVDHRAGVVLTQDRIRVPSRYCEQATYIELVADVFDGRICVSVCPVNGEDEKYALIAARQALKRYATLYRDKYFYGEALPPYSLRSFQDSEAQDHFGKELGKSAGFKNIKLTFCVRHGNPRERNPIILPIWEEMRKDCIEPYLAQNPRGWESAKAFEYSLKQWARVRWNGSKRMRPWGLTPLPSPAACTKPTPGEKVNVLRIRGPTHIKK